LWAGGPPAAKGHGHPLTISQVIQDVKKVSARRLHQGRETVGGSVASSILGTLCASRKEFGERLEYMHLNPVRKNRANRPDERRWSFALEKAVAATCPIQIDVVHMPHDYRA
jgi:hypothetical protein